MSKVALVTDSTAYIPKEILAQYPITVAPQVLIWGNETFRDGIDILPDEFYRRLKTAKVMPSTSQVHVQDFVKIFSELTEQGYDVLALLISEKLSGTIASAVQAKEALPKARIEIFDSHTTAMAMGFQVLTVARAAQAGAGMTECLALARRVSEQVGVVFAVDTLEFLHRGGRIGGAARFLGTAISLKPILEVVDGRVEAVEKIRTRSKSLARLKELVRERIGERQPVRLATIHANATEDARQVLSDAAQEFNAVETILSEVSPVVGTHAGPGVVGLCYMAGE